MNEKIATEINEVQTTITILKPFEQRRQQYIINEQALKERENRQKERHAQELYKEDKDLRLAEAPFQMESNLQLAALQAPLNAVLQPEYKQTRANIIKKENKELIPELSTVGRKYWRVQKEQDQLKEKLLEMKLDVELGKERLDILRKRKEKKSKVNKKEVDKIVEAQPSIVETRVVTQEEKTDFVETDSKYTQTEDVVLPEKELLKHVYDAIVEELGVSDYRRTVQYTVICNNIRGSHGSGNSLGKMHVNSENIRFFSKTTEIHKNFRYRENAYTLNPAIIIIIIIII